MLKICYADTSIFNNDTLLQAAMSRLPHHRYQKAVSLKLRSAKNLSVGAWLTLVETLKSLNIDIDSLIFDTEKNGKPYIKNADLHFSLSHSGTISLCAVSSSGIGADIEEVTDFKPELAKRYFKNSEYLHILSKTEKQEQIKEFFRIWTLKESYVKMNGKGLGGFSETEIIPTVPPGVRRDVSGIEFLEFDIPSYKIAICGHNLSTDVIPEKINLVQQLINF